MILVVYISFLSSCGNLKYVLRFGQFSYQDFEILGYLLSQAAAKESSGSLQLPDQFIEDNYEIKSMDLVKFIYQTCGWDEKYLYRTKGIIVPIRNMVIFDLSQAIKFKDLRELKMMEKAGS